MIGRTMKRLSRKAGPLPVWAWVLIVGGLGVWYYRRRVKGSSSS